MFLFNENWLKTKPHDKKKTIKVYRLAFLNRKNNKKFKKSTNSIFFHMNKFIKKLKHISGTRFLVSNSFNMYQHKLVTCSCKKVCSCTRSLHKNKYSKSNALNGGKSKSKDQATAQRCGVKTVELT